MKKDFMTVVGVALAGFLLAFIMTNIFMPEVKDYSYTTIETAIRNDVDAPDDSVFNYLAINPTVEVYVGNDEVVNNSTDYQVDTTNNNQAANNQNSDLNTTEENAETEVETKEDETSSEETDKKEEEADTKKEE